MKTKNLAVKTYWAAPLKAISLIGLALFATTPAVNAAIIQDSHVTDNVTQTGPSTWHYEFEVFNDATGFDDETGNIGVIIDWELPYFDDMGITNITSPFGWTATIETIGVANAATGWDGVAAWTNPSDPWYIELGGATNPIFTATQVLHWYCVDPAVFQGEGVFGGCFGGEAGINSIILPGNSLAGFGFDAAYGPTQAPYQTSWMELPVNTGDPAFPGGGASTVGSPSTQQQRANVISPAPVALIALGLFSLALRRRVTA